MYHIMLVDDNRLSVDGIAHNIDWAALDAEVIHRAYDGDAALAALEEAPIDLIVSDIEMPQLSGLALAEKALAKNPSIKIILISAFDKFEYAKQAVRIGAFDYVEKPLDYGYLSDMIQKALQTLEQERRNLDILKRSKPVMIDNFFTELLHSSSDEAGYIISNYQEYLNLQLDHRYVQAAILRIENDREIKERLGIEEYHIRMLGLADLIREEFGKHFSMVHILTNFNKLIILIGHNYSNRKLFQSLSSGLFSRIADAYQNDLMELNIGVGAIVRYLQDLSISYENASKALEYSFFFPQKNVFDMRDTIRKEVPMELFTDHQEEQLIQLVCQKDLDAIQRWIQAFSEKLLDNYQSKQFIFIQVYFLLGRLLRFMYEMDLDADETEKEIIDVYSRLEHVSTSQELFQWLSKICCNLCQKLDASVKNHHEHICAATIGYINDNYQSSTLCLQNIADYVNVSPAHLSALFKKTQKQNISDIITSVRIHAACQLLSNSTASLKEISTRVGYSNQYYFSSCFKKKMGMTPSTYREEHKSHL